MPKRFPRLFSYHKATLGNVMDAHLGDPRLKALFAALWPYLGLPPSRLSFVYWAVMLQSFLEEGAFYCQGSFQRLADAVVEALKTHGGELLLRSEVRRILVEDGHVIGVMLENGQRIQAPVVVSNADAHQTFEELIGEEATIEPFEEPSTPRLETKLANGEVLYPDQEAAATAALTHRRGPGAPSATPCSGEACRLRGYGLRPFFFGRNFRICIHPVFLAASTNGEERGGETTPVYGGG
jgi:phytoene dehydrogenase-like protein